MRNCCERASCLRSSPRAWARPRLNHTKPQTKPFLAARVGPTFGALRGPGGVNVPRRARGPDLSRPLIVTLVSRSSPRAWARHWSGPVEWCNRFVSFGVGYALSWSGGSSCWVGWRACHGVNAHCQRFACERRTRWRRCVHNAGHLAHDAPLSAFVTEVVCDVGGAAPRRDLTDSKRGELRCTGTRA